MSYVPRAFVCVQCEKPFSVQPSKVLAMHERGLCSRQCLGEAAKETRVCPSCRATFRAYRTHKDRFCTKTCRTTGKTTLVSCLECGDAFRVKPYRVRAGEAKYCSATCKGRAQDEGRTSADHRFRRSSEYRAWRADVFARDDFTCQECYRRGGWLEADHIKSFNLFPELRLVVGNGRTLCKPCHKLTPTYGGRSRRPKAA